MKVEYFSLPELKQLIQHSQSIGWYTEEEWQTFLRTGVVIGHRLQSGEIVSSAYFSNFENKAGSLGAVIVNSRFQGKKLGKALIEKVIGLIPNEEFVLSLIATQRGKQMYEQAGFVEIGNTHKFVLDRVAKTESLESLAKIEDRTKAQVRVFRESDIQAVLRLDRMSIGYDRKKLIVERLQNSSVAMVLESSEGEVSGFIVKCPDEKRWVLGPVLASSPEDALHLILSIMSSHQSYRIDIPHWQSRLIQMVSNYGFQLERICPMMTFKGRPLLATSDQYFAIMNQALG